MENAHKLLSTSLSALYVSLLALGLAIIHVNMLDSYGFAGVVGFKAEGMALSCGGRYQPTQLVVFHENLPCNSTVAVINPETRQSVIATVVNQNVMFGRDNSRIVDISPAVANAIGINPQALAAQRVVVRTHLTWAPVIPHLIKDIAFKNTDDLNQKDFATLTNNLLGECGNCSPLGMVAVAQVTQNRATSKFNGKSTLHDVVYDKQQFSWVKLNPTLRSAQGNRRQARTVASLFMLGRLSGEALAVQYRLTTQATHYFAPKLIATPAWARNGKLKHVNISNTLEAELHHRFYASKPIQIASR